MKVTFIALPNREEWTYKLATIPQRGDLVTLPHDRERVWEATLITHHAAYMDLAPRVEVLLTRET